MMKKKHKTSSPVFKALLGKRNFIALTKKDKSKNRTTKIAQKRKNQDLNHE